MTAVRTNQLNQNIGRPMGGVKSDDQPIFRLALCKIDAWVMIQFLNKVHPLTVGKSSNGQFTSKQKLRLVC